ncbi:hypothetical protein SISNIDRAFT_530292 [Sistotremastrum niveocremeum HHB9708]|uniref:F-box domain-containing protein n=1 Tax=Sistotremastrum niveocremeum HHB9708 TaxID=1314777 RepID=A0A164Z250_9AGAM|nr:hypothetical protein SISNIDRAFT_530292 [Sistotremastrum niveocremeum HHB9708]
MGSIGMLRLVESIRDAMDAADKQIDAYVQTVLKNADVSSEPLASRLREMRRDAREVSSKRTRVMAALKNLPDTKQYSQAVSLTALLAYRDTKIQGIENGEVLDRIIYSPEPESVVLRMEMNRQSPIHRIPVELSSMIFEEVIARYWDISGDPSKPNSFGSHNTRGALSAPVRISHVCSYWRHIMLANGSFWSRVCQSWPRGAVSTFLARSRGSPLHIVACCGYSDDGRFANDPQSFIADHLPVLKGFEFHNYQETPRACYEFFATFNRIWDIQAPSLIHVKLSSGCYKPDFPDIGLALFENFPHLRSLDLTGFKLPDLEALPMLSSLTSLALSKVEGQARGLSSSEVHTLLNRTPNLEHLVMENLTFRANESSEERFGLRVDLPRCKKVYIQLSEPVAPNSLLSVVTFPNVESLFIEHSYDPDAIIFSRYDNLPSYIQEMLLQCESLGIRGGDNTAIAKYTCQEGTSAWTKKTFTFQAGQSYLIGDQSLQHRQDMVPIIASVMNHLPVGDITHLVITDFSGFGHPVDAWKATFCALDTVIHFEAYRMLKKITSNLSKALGDPMSLPKLTRFDLDLNSYNVKDLHRALSLRTKKVPLQSLYIFDTDEDKTLSNERMLQIDSDCAVKCYTNCWDLKEF